MPALPAFELEVEVGVAEEVVLLVLVLDALPALPVEVVAVDSVLDVLVLTTLLVEDELVDAADFDLPALTLLLVVVGVARMELEVVDFAFAELDEDETCMLEEDVEVVDVVVLNLLEVEEDDGSAAGLLLLG